MAVNIEIREEGNAKKVYRDGVYYGQFTKLDKGYRWKNILADRINSPFTQGEVKTEAEALMMLGFRIKKAKVKDDDGTNPVGSD